MKNLLTGFLLFSAFITSAQSVTGLYAGKLVNDSTKKTQTYELALSDYRGNITGYSYTTFVVHDTFYYSIKRVHAVRKDNQLVVEDVKMIVNNFPEAPAKHVHQVNYIRLNPNEDTLRQAAGKWETTKTKIYYSLHGAVAMHRDDDSTHSALINHLKELRIISEDDHYSDAIVVKQTAKEPSVKSKVKTNILPAVVSKPVAPSILPYSERKNHIMQHLEVQSDSLELSFYDNGVIDGDSISVYVNGKNVVSNCRLLAVATKKKIDISHLDGDIQILVVAENLGTIPPNTGLVVVKDGEELYQINFTADMQTNASIILQRKKSISR